MDPTQALEDARRALDDYRHSGGAAVLALGAAARLADAFSALDDWLTHGGYFPQQWVKDRPPSDY